MAAAIEPWRGRPQGDKGATLTDPSGAPGEFDLRVQDPAFLEEIDLYSELIIVAAASAETLSIDAIDQALGLHKAKLADSL
jgi:hypothetical protein